MEHRYPLFGNVDLRMHYHIRQVQFSFLWALDTCQLSSELALRLYGWTLTPCMGEVSLKVVHYLVYTGGWRQFHEHYLPTYVAHPIFKHHGVQRCDMSATLYLSHTTWYHSRTTSSAQASNLRSSAAEYPPPKFAKLIESLSFVTDKLTHGQRRGSLTSIVSRTSEC